MRCLHIDCPVPATCALGLAIYPPECVQTYFGTREPLSRLLTGVTVCERHFTEQAGRGAFDLLSKEHVKQLARHVERATGTTVDLELTIVTRIKLDDPEFLRYQARGLH